MAISRRTVLEIGALGGLASAGDVSRAASAQTADPAPAGKPAATPDLAIVKGAGRREPRARNPKSGGVDPRALAAAQAFSDSLGGEALLVWRDGRLVYERYAEGIDPGAPLRAYSMAKSVFGLAFGLAVEDGLVGLEDPLGRHLSEWRDDPRGEITLRQLLQMRSGLKLYALGLREPGAYALMFGHDIAAAALATPLVRPPDAEFEYANVNCVLAGLALSRALKRAGVGSYQGYLSTRLWAPLGQNDAVLELDAPGGAPRFFAGLGACGRDWVRLGRLFVEGGRSEGRQVVPEAWIAAMCAPSANPSYGLLLWRGSPYTPLRSYGPVTPAKVPCKEPYAAPDMVFFDGAGGQRVYASKSARVVIVRSGRQSPDWEDSTLPNLIIRGFT